jgi:hypothetical protein
MTCKCGKPMILTRLTVGLNLNYCYKCGRACVDFKKLVIGIEHKSELSWYESTKSINPNLITRANLKEILKEVEPKGVMSVKNIGKKEVIKEIEKKIAELPKS